MKYYLIGIKGSGMSTLAQILYDLGYEVSGYDDNTDYKFTEEGLIKRHIPIYHDGKNKRYDSVEKLKSQFNKLSLPILENNYFIKKAELIYNDIYKK